MKGIEKLFEKQLRYVVKLDKMQMRFMHGTGTVEVIFILRQVLDNYNMAGKKLYIVLVDLEKACDHLSRMVIWWALRKV